MANEYKLSYTGSEINEKLAKIDELDTKSTATNLVNGTGEISLMTIDATAASGYDAFALGLEASATKDGSFALGPWTTASGECAFATGYKTTASGYNSHAEGYGTTASGDYAHVQGRYNIPDTTSIHIVGNGSYGTVRSNAHTLDWQGNAWFAGDVYVGSTSGTNKDEGSKKLATVADLEAAIGTAIGGSY